MVIFRPTARLAARMGLKLAASNHRSDTRLGDWYAKDFSLGRLRLVLCVSEPSRLAVLLEGSPSASVPERLPAAVRQLLRGIVPVPEAIEREIAAMQTLSIAKTQSRSVLGTLNEYEWHLRCRPDLVAGSSPLDLNLAALWLSETVTSVLPGISPRVAAIQRLLLPTV